MQSVLLAQIGFSAFSMLAWALAATIPIAIHLLRKRRQTTIKWAAMELLQRVIDQQSRRTRLQQLILLLLRVAALLLLAIALARPFLASDAKGLNESNGRPNRVLIMLVDTSYSMGYRNPSGATRLDQAKQYLNELIDSSKTGDAFVLLAMEDPTRAVISSPTFDAQGALAELRKLKESACGCNIVEALAITENIAAECKRSESLPRELLTVIVSDLGRDAWQAERFVSESSGDERNVSNNSQTKKVSESLQANQTGDESRRAASVATAKPEIVQALNQLKRISSLHIEPLTDVNPINQAIVSVTTSTSRPMLGSSFTVDVRIASYGQPAKDFPVQLELDGQVIASQSIDIDANGIAQVRFQASVNSLGSHVVSAIIPADGLTVDNRFDLVVEAATGNRILVVQNGSRTKNAWQVALQAAGEEISSSQLQIRTVSEVAWSSLSLNEWDLLILDDIAVSPTQWNKVATFVESGKGVVVNWGARQSLPQLAAQSDLLRRIVGFDFQNTSDEGDWTIDPLEYRSPIVAPFAGFPNSGLLTTPIFRYWKIANRSEDLKIDVSLNTGDPWLVRNRLGKGWIASLLSAPESGQQSSSAVTWNAITTWPSFLPLAQQLLQSISDIDNQAYNRLAGQPIGDRISLTAPVNTVRLQLPDGAELELTTAQAADASSASWNYGDTSQRGVYQVLDPQSSRRVFAINIDPVQSSLESLDPQNFSEYLKSNSADEDDSPEQPASGDDRLARALLVTLMIILLSESLLAWSLGRQSS